MNKGQSQHWRYSEAALSKAYRNIRARQDNFLFFFCIYYVGYYGGCCSGWWILWGKMWQDVALIELFIVKINHFGVSRKAWLKNVNSETRRCRECALARKNGGFESGYGASVTDTFRIANKWASHENSVISCWCCSWGGSPRCRLSRIDRKNRRITILPGCFKMLNAHPVQCVSVLRRTLLLSLPTILTISKPSNENDMDLFFLFLQLMQQKKMNLTLAAQPDKH